MFRILFVLCVAVLAVHCQTINVIQTAKYTTDRLTPKMPIQFATAPPPPLSFIVTVNPTYPRQEILGFGGAFTEAAAVTFGKLSPSLQEEVIEAYFGESGHGYSVCRTHINSCDYSVSSYSFDDTVNDYSLEHFDVSHNKEYMFPLIKRAMSASVRPVKLFGSPWSPPAWMKTNNQMDGSGQPGLIQDPKIFASWALYYSKTITEYEKVGIKFWGITIQNEPEFAAPWEACCYNPTQQLDFLKNYLGPQMKQDHPNVSIMIYDHNKDHIVDWVKTFFSDPAGVKYADGTAFHWYTGPQFENLATAHEFAPNKYLLATEGGIGPLSIGNWDYGERMGYDIIGDLNNWAVGWTDWNILLDIEGGPNHLNGHGDAPILADIDAQKLVYEPTFYYMGHFSRYITPGSIILSTTVSNEYLMSAVSAISPTGNYVVVVQNQNDSPLKYILQHGNKTAQNTIPGHSIQTLVYPV